ncbi:hypothetical protein OG589_33385 [Sphaerisporangium sp. NBC_01403]|uniref:hypothetical protein n=1 Tax=Sphaerisporangium sp. NBC_01403 TaxID=2903599 RepID=UPI0032466CE6
MARVPEGVNRHELTVVARRVLLDALEALKEQLNAVVLVGAQAVHLHTGHVLLASSAYTSDADLTLNPADVLGEPLLDERMKAAGFELNDPFQPGIWTRTEMIGGQPHRVGVDLLVPEGLAPVAGGRSAQIPPHSKMATRRVLGLEAAVFDRSVMPVASLEPEVDGRQFKIQVAGPPALLIAKAFKIRDRLRSGVKSPGRLTDKDAADVVRLMMAARNIRPVFDRLAMQSQIRNMVLEGCELLHDQFGSARGDGVQMAVRALTGDLPEERIRLLAPAFVRENGP